MLIDLFERKFIEAQEALRMRVIGQFRVPDDPNQFVWLRGFSDMRRRAEALKAFYLDSPMWKAHRAAANATIIDSDNVLLLRLARPSSGFSLDPNDRPPIGATEIPQGLMVATIYSFDSPVDINFLDFFEDTLAPALKECGSVILAYFVTEESVTDFPALPVRSGEHVFVWFSVFRDQAAYGDHMAAQAQSPHWQGELSPALARHLKKPAEILRLEPSARSLVHG